MKFICHFSDAAGQNKQHSAAKNTAKLDRETEELHHDKIGLDVGKLVQQGRSEKKMTQKELATVICVHLFSGFSIHFSVKKKIFRLKYFRRILSQWWTVWATATPEFLIALAFLFFQKINQKPQVINDYEAGRAIPNQQILGKLERALGKNRLCFVLFLGGARVWDGAACCWHVRVVVAADEERGCTWWGHIVRRSRQATCSQAAFAIFDWPVAQQTTSP